MRVLLTGSAGFIAKHVAAALETAGHEWDAFDLPHGDVTDARQVAEAVADVDAVVHLAGILGTQEHLENPYPAVHVNTLGSLNVFSALGDKPCVMLVCGNWFAANSYAISKTAAENFARMFNLYRGARINIVRAVNAYGPGQAAAEPFGPSKVRKIMPAFICRALSGMPVEVYGDGKQISDMVHVRAVADALVMALTRAASGDVWDRPGGIGPLAPQTVGGIAAMVCEAVGGGTITHLPMRPGEDPARAVHMTDCAANFRIHTVPIPRLEDGIRETVEWYRANEGITWRKPNGP